MNRSPSIAERKTLLLLVDLILVNSATLFALWIQSRRSGIPFDRGFVAGNIEWVFLLAVLWLLSAFLSGLYDTKNATDYGAAASSLLRAGILVVIFYMAIYFLSANPNSIPRRIVADQGLESFLLIALWRMFYISISRRPALARKVIIIGAGWAGRTIAKATRRHAGTQYRIVGFVDDDVAQQGTFVSLSEELSEERRVSPDPTASPAISLPVLGTSKDLVRLVREQDVAELILAITHDLSTPMFQYLMDVREQGVQITLMPTLFEELAGQVPIEHIGDNWNVALPLDSAESGGFYPLAKRLFDIVGALIGLALFLPLLPFLALAIYLDSPGPIFYTQERVGRGGKVFRLIKLRTMIPGAEPDGQAVRAQTNDPRVTRVGRWLRKLRLDEMPQLFNILKGEMSAVGPRPERPEHAAELDELLPFHRLRNSVRPGMAGWAAVNYGYIDSLEDAKIRLQYDLYYIKHQSIWLDLLILLQMVGHVLTLRGR